MKIAIVVNQFPALSQTFVLNHITGLIDRGHDVDIYANMSGDDPRAHPEIAKYNLLKRTYYRPKIPRGRLVRLAKGMWLLVSRLTKGPKKVVVLAIRATKYRREDTWSALFYSAVPWIDKGMDYDIVHCHFGPNGNKAAILMELGVLKGKLITTFHGYDIRKGIPNSGRMYSWLRERCDAVYCISEYNRTHLEAFGFDRRRIFFHPVGISFKRFQPKDYDPETLSSAKRVTIITVARLAEEKGLSFALNALARVRAQHSNIQFLYRIIGSGPLERSLRGIVRELGIENIVEFVGPQEQTVVARMLRQGDLFLLPSTAEALPVSIMEAMACGLPVIATDVGSISELVKDGVTGWLVPPADQEGLSAGLSRGLSECRRWGDIGRAGRELVATRHDIEVLNDKLVEHYRSILGSEWPLDTLGDQE